MPCTVRSLRVLATAYSLAILLLCLPNLAQSALQVAAGWEINVKGPAFDNFGHATGPVPYRGQTFTAVRSGTLASIHLRIGRVGLQPNALMRIEVRSLDSSGQPGGSALAAVEVPVEVLPNMVSDQVRFDFSATGLSLEGGKSYAIVAFPVPFHPSGDPYFLNGDQGTAATYAGGEAISSTDGVHWQFYPDVDYGFEVRLAESVTGRAESWGRVKGLY